jgi:hypothetical protein
MRREFILEEGRSSVLPRWKCPFCAQSAGILRQNSGKGHEIKPDDKTGQVDVAIKKEKSQQSIGLTAAMASRVVFWPELHNQQLGRRNLELAITGERAPRTLLFPSPSLTCWIHVGAWGFHFRSALSFRYLQRFRARQPAEPGPRRANELFTRKTIGSTLTLTAVGASFWVPATLPEHLYQQHRAGL